MDRKFNKGDRVKFNESAVAEVRGKTGIINKFLGVQRISFPRLEHGKTINTGVYKDVDMWEIRLDNLNKLYPSPEDWLEKIA